MFPVMGTPKCVAFRSKLTGKYLQSVHEGSKQGAGRGGSKFFFEEVSGAAVAAADEGEEEEEEDVHVLASPYTRFYLEPSKEHDGLLHVRCCHNNTYWVAKHGADGGRHWTIGIVNEPDGDLSRPSCTLFEPVPLTDVDNNLSIRFLRPQQTPRSESAGRAEETAEEEAYLHLGTRGGHADQEKSLNEFLVLELSQMVLPKYVVFKGDNKMYLRARLKPFPHPILGNNYLEFAGTDITDPTAINTIFAEHVGGIVRIRSNYFNRYWRRTPESPDWIWANAIIRQNPDIRFKVVQVSDYFALQNLGNHKYCKRLTDGQMTSCLNAAADTITLEARLHVEEAVLERQIDNVTFRLQEARIYGETPIFIPRVTSTNTTTDPGNKSLTMKYTARESRSYTGTVGLKIGVEVKFRAGFPIIADGKVTVSTQVSTKHTWGKTTQQTRTLKTEYKAVVPSMTRVTLTAAATQGSVDVPFSYRQRDVLTTGQVVVQTLHDGLFTGVNSYNFHFETTEERL